MSDLYSANVQLVRMLEDREKRQSLSLAATQAQLMAARAAVEASRPKK